MRIFLSVVTAGTLAAGSALASSLLVLEETSESAAPSITAIGPSSETEKAEDARAAADAATDTPIVVLGPSIIALGEPPVTTEITAAVDGNDDDTRATVPRGRPPLVMRGGVAGPAAVRSNSAQQPVGTETSRQAKTASASASSPRAERRASSSGSSSTPKAAPAPRTAVPSSLPQLGAPE